MKMNPYLHFEGNAEEALNFYKDAFGGEILMLSRYGDSPEKTDEEWKHKIIHARLQFGDNLLMLSDGFKDYKIDGKGNIQLSVEMDSEEQLHEVFNKMSESGTVTMPVAKQFWGAHFGMLIDKFGVAWMFNYTLG
jgi:PhnB protein